MEDQARRNRQRGHVRRAKTGCDAQHHSATFAGPADFGATKVGATQRSAVKSGPERSVKLCSGGCLPSNHEARSALTPRMAGHPTMGPPESFLPSTEMFRGNSGLHDIDLGLVPQRESRIST